MTFFHHLPVEIALEVIKCFCPHCTRETQGRCMHGNCAFTPGCNCAHYANHRDDPFHVATLARLCRVSKRLNSIATPHLYHRPTCAKWWLLARTLIARPDLGLLVRALHGHLWIRYAETAGRFPQEVLDYFSRRSKDTLERAEVMALLEAPNWGEDWEETTPLDVLTSLCPNLEEVEAVIGDENHLAFDWSTHEPRKRLGSIELRHADAAGGIEFGHIRNLITFAPNLTRMVCHSLDFYEMTLEMQDAERHPFASLVDLRLHHSIISADVLPIVLAACPRLQSFTFESGGLDVWDNQLTPWNIQQALIRHTPNLLSLSVNYAKDAKDLPQLPSSYNLLMRSFAGLSKLEHLSLDMTCIVQLDFGLNELYNPASAPAPDPRLLVDLLPASIRSLKLKRDEYMGASLTLLRDALTELLAAIVMSKVPTGTHRPFPKLEKITLAGVGDESFLEFKLLFEALGVKCCLLKFGI